MIVKITKIEEQETKYGRKKILLADDGRKFNVNESNKCWDYVKTPGPYDIEMGEYQGHPFVKKLRFQGAYNDGAVGAAAKTSGSAKTDYSQRLEFDKERQKEIKMECYASIAKDIVIHNAEISRSVISATDVMSVANNLVMLHDDILANKRVGQLPADVDEMVKEVQKTFDGAYEGELPA